jgi:hypothetical protein
MEENSPSDKGLPNIAAERPLSGKPVAQTLLANNLQPVYPSLNS